jgi:hypothetical protein
MDGKEELGKEEREGNSSIKPTSTCRSAAL